jgi:D-alanine-D-alanine ligase
MGEDGTVQGLIKLAGFPFIGASVLGSAVGMDKDVMKRLLKETSLPVGRFLATTSKTLSFQEVIKKIGCPFFVKPANTGSSVGVHKVRKAGEYKKFLADAFKFDTKIILEEFVRGREIECSVLGNERPAASLPGEVVAHHDFYSYETKYLDKNGADLIVPAKISPAKIKEVKKMAVKVFRTLACEGMGRVDFFLKKDGRLVVNEINTIPGLTSISMYPKMWEASGLKAKDLLDCLVRLSMERFNQEQKIFTSIKI